MQPIATGAVISPPDYRDYYAASSVAPLMPGLPPEFQTKLDAPFMQHLEPACVSHSITELLKLHFYASTGKWINFSPRFLDTLVKRFDGQDRETGGTYPRLVLKLAAEYGCATEDTLPNNTTLPVLSYRNDAKLTPGVFADAARYKIPGYVRVHLADTRAFIYRTGAVSTLFAIGNELFTPSWKDSDIDPLRTPKSIISGHQMTPKGWVGTFNTLRNSWSADWANNGEAKYDQSLWEPYIYEQWAIAEVPHDVRTLLKTLPAPNDFHYVFSTDVVLGDNSDAVKAVQIGFMILGFLSPLPLSELGAFGPKTAAATAKFQQAHRIQLAPNNVGPKTRAALNQIFAL